MKIRILHALEERDLDGLCAVLADCVAGGASVGFLAPMTRAKAETFWRRVGQAMARGARRLLVAEDDAGRMLGTVQLAFSEAENQPHRADLAKMLVRREARGRGVGAALLAAAEREAVAAGRTLLVLDTATPEADRLYARHGWTLAGEIPRYALMPDGVECATRLYYKSLSRA